MPFRPLVDTSTEKKTSGFRPIYSSESAVNEVRQRIEQPEEVHPLNQMLTSQSQTNTQAALTTLKNIPGSAVNFVKGAIQQVNPFHTAANITEAGHEFSALKGEAGGTGKALLATAKEIPGAAYHTLVPAFIQHLVKGDMTQAQEALQTDPVGQIAPLILMARGAAEGAGKGVAFDEAVSKATKPVAKPIEGAITKTGEGIKSGAAEGMGISTGAGGEAIRQAYGAGVAEAKTPGGGATFTEAMRGGTSPTEIVNNAQEALQSVREAQKATYQKNLEGIKGQKASLDISPLKNELNKQLKGFGIKVGKEGLDFSRSSIGNDPAAMNAVKAAYEDVNSWGTKAGDRTAIGLDTLKHRLDDLYSPTKQSRAFTQALRSSVRKTLGEQVKGYNELTKGYENTAHLIDDIKSATSLGGKAGVDTVFKKLTSSLKQNQELRLQMVKALEKESGKDINAQVAGENLNSLLPRGLVGKGADIFAVASAIKGAIHPAVLVELALTSPRIVGEFVRGLGYASEKTSSILKDVGIMRKFMKSRTMVPNANEPEKPQE